MGRIKLLKKHLDKVKSIVEPRCSQEILKAALSSMGALTVVLLVMSSLFSGHAFVLCHALSLKYLYKVISCTLVCCVFYYYVCYQQDLHWVLIRPGLCIVSEHFGPLKKPP